jgi:hypothetical protein
MYNSSLGIFRAVWCYCCLLMMADLLWALPDPSLPEKAYRHGGKIDPMRGIYCAVLLFLFDCKRNRQGS